MASSLDLNNGAFHIEGLFTLTQREHRTGRVEIETLTGDLYTYFPYYREQFVVSFPKLTQEQRDILDVLCSPSSGHLILKYETPSGIRLWSDVYDTYVPGVGINDDVKRWRHSIYVQKEDGLPHWDGVAVFFSATLTCLET